MSSKIEPIETVHVRAIREARLECHFPNHADKAVAKYLEIMRAAGYELDGAGAREWERERAARIVEDWEVYNPYIVGKEQIRNRKSEISSAIRGTAI
jgi:protein-tyrosine-phosphatase